MKKVLFTMIVLASFAFVFSSCEKEEEYTAPAMTTAKIEGRVQSNLNLQATGLESVPDGTKLFARINLGDLVQYPIAGYNYEDKIYTTTASGGKYTFTIEAGTQPVTVSIWGEDFEYTLVNADGTPQTDRTVLTLTEGWYGTTISGGDHQVIDLVY
ncbi:MAG: hypothetical protein JXR58_11625 [Bacteroidales bacterium]|nr:hypothetical protein [Bacteroidales bacterium]